MATSQEKFSQGYKGKRRRRPPRLKNGAARRPRREVAGPYRSQSSVPSVRRKATKREHRKASVDTRSAQERREAAARAALQIELPKRPSKADRRRRHREQRAIRTLLGPRVSKRSPTPKVPTLTAKQSSNRPGYTPDPTEIAVEKDVIKPLQAEGKLPKHPTLGQEIYSGIAHAGKLAGELALFGPELRAAGEAVAAGVRGAKVGDEVIGGSKVLGKVLKPVEASGSRAEAAARAAREAKASRAAARGGSGVRATARRAAAKATRTEARAAKTAAREVTGRRGARATFAEAAPAAKVAKVGSTQALPVVRGHEQALAENPGKTARTTARAIPGLVTVPVGQAAGLATAGGRAVSAGLHEAGIPGFRGYSASEIAAPVAGIGREQLAFAKQVAKILTTEDSAEVQKAVEDELGLLLPIMLGLGTKAVGGKLTKGRVTEGVRRVVENVRERAGREHGRHNGGTPRLFETAGQRKAEAKRAARHRTHSERERRDRTEPILREARKAKGSEVVRRGVGPRRGLRGRPADLEVRTHDLVGFAVRHGLPLDKPREALAEVKRIASQIRDLPEGTTLPADKIFTRDVIRYIERNPHVLADPHLRAAVDRYRAQARHARETPGISPEHSEPGRFMSTAVTHGVPLASERFPRSIRGQTRAEPTRGAEAKDVLRREAKSDRQRAKRLGRKAATREARARAISRELAIRERSEPTRAKTNAAVRAKGQRMESQATTYRRGQKQAAELAKRKRRAAYEVDPAVGQEFVNEMRARLREVGKPEPEYVHTGKGRETPTYGATGAKLTNFPGRSKRKRGGAEEYGMVREDLPHMLRESIARPISRRESYAAMRSFLADNEYVASGRPDRSEFTSDEARQLFEDGVISRDRYVLIPRQLYKRAYGKFDPEVAAAELKLSLDGEAPGRHFKIVRRAAAEEFFDQLTAQFSPKLARINQATSALILKTSPAWAASQIVAEYAQAAVARPKLLNPRFVRRAIRAYRQMPAHERQAFDSWVGVTTRSLESPDDMRLELGTGDMKAADDAIRALDRTPLGKLITAIPKGIGKLDEWKGGRIRTLVVAAKLDRDMNRRTVRFLRGIRGMHDEIAKVSKEMVGKPLSEQLSYMTEHPELAHRYANYLDDVMGNWSALTKRERTAAGLVIFYPFLRMSLRWTFYAFPKRHPIKAAMLLYLGQQNATELKKLLGQDPSFWTGWANVPLHLGDGETRLIPLSRIAPGLGPAVEAIGEGVGSGDLGAVSQQTLRGVQPVIAAAITAVTGVDPLSGEQEPNRGIAALAQLLTLPAVVRVADELLTPSGEKPTEAALPVVGPLFGSTERQKALDKLFGKLEQRRSPIRVARALVAPPIPRDTKLERDLTRLRSILEALEANSSDKRRELGEQGEEEAAGAPEGRHRQIERRVSKEATEMKRRQDKAQKALDKMFAAYGIKADPWTGDVYSIGAYGAKPSTAPPAGYLGGKRVRGASNASSTPPPAGTLGGKPVRGRLTQRGIRRSGELEPRSVPPAGTLGGVKVR